MRSAIHRSWLGAPPVFLILGALSAACAQFEGNIDVPYVPTPEETVERMLTLAEVGPEDYVIDLGSGDGRIPIAAARRGARGLGIELDVFRVDESRARAEAAKLSDRVRFLQRDLFQTDISPATVLTMYLLPHINMKLRPRLLDELEPGTRVVSHQFTLGDWRPDADSVSPRGSNAVYLWIVPAKVAGSWDVQIGGEGAGGERLTLVLSQRFQEIAGVARPGAGPGAATPILAEAQLRGREIGFTLIDGAGPDAPRRRARGQVEGDVMSGMLSADGRAGLTPWRARRTAQ